MAIVNMNQLFDKLKEYIDTKINLMEVELRELFEEYGLKDIKDYLNEIKTVADNIEIIQPIGAHIADIINCSDNMDAIIEAPQNAIDAKNAATVAKDARDSSLLYRDQAEKWSQEEFNIPVDDGTHTGYSSYHYALISKYYSQGLNWVGTWDPNSGSYPTATNSGDFWTVIANGHYDGQNWFIGDNLFWDGTQFLRVPNLVTWESIQNKPSVYPPEVHQHDDRYYREDEHINQSDGPSDTNKPIVLNAEGMVDNSMIKLPIVYLAGSWTPVQGNEYPDTTGFNVGATWMVTGLGVNGYTFTTGDLVGQRVDNNDWMIWTAKGFMIRKDDLSPVDFYKRDGSYPLTGDLTAANHKLVNVAKGVNSDDAVIMEQLSELSDDVFKKTDHIFESVGVSDAYKPILLNGEGFIDTSMSAFTSLTYQGGWNPTAGGGEYPPNAEIGDYWDIYGVGASGYEFTTGDLQGRTAYEGDMLLRGKATWGLRETGGLDPTIYYKLDGTKPITGPFNSGNQQIKYMAEGTDIDDGVTVSQLNTGLSGKAPISHTHGLNDIPHGSGSGLDADLLDGKDSSEFAGTVHQHSTADITSGLGSGGGFDADMVDGKHASEFMLKADGVSYNDLDDVPSTFPPVTAAETVIGGMKVWVDGDVLNFSTQ